MLKTSKSREAMRENLALYAGQGSVIMFFGAPACASGQTGRPRSH